MKYFNILKPNRSLINMPTRLSKKCIKLILNNLFYIKVYWVLYDLSVIFHELKILSLIIFPILSNKVKMESLHFIFFSFLNIRIPSYSP